MKLNKCKRVGVRLLLILLVSAAGSFLFASTASAVNIYDYFTIDYNTSISAEEIRGDELFSATVQGIASCKQDLPLVVSQGQITSRVVAYHRTSGQRVVLNPGYTLVIKPFPDEAGQTYRPRAVVELEFPPESSAGIYDIVGELIEAGVQSVYGNWLPVDEYLPATEDLGAISYLTFEEAAAAPPPAPAVFSLTNLVITPEQVIEGEEATVSVVVSNTGELGGSCPVTLEIDGALKGSSEIFLTGGESQLVTFEFTGGNAGSCTVDVNGLVAALEVQEAPQTTNWQLFWPLIAAVAAAIAIPLALRRRRLRS